MTKRQRAGACGFDLLLATGLGWVPSLAVPLLGIPVCAVYWLMRDGLFHGQSVGKRLFGLRVVHAATQQPCTFGRLCARNALWLVPLVNAVLLCEAAWCVGHHAAGRHWGDRLAETAVVPSA